MHKLIPFQFNEFLLVIKHQPITFGNNSLLVIKRENLRWVGNLIIRVPSIPVSSIILSFSGRWNILLMYCGFDAVSHKQGTHS